MEANCEEVLATAEKVRRRTSKWDVPEEHHVETEIKIEDVLPANIDDTYKIDDVLPANVDDTYKIDDVLPANVVDTYKIDDVLPANVDDTFIDHTELDFPRPSLSMDIDESEIDKSTNQSGMVSDNTIIQSDVICEMPQNPKQFALEGECEDGFEKHDWDHVSKKHTMPEHVENPDKQLKGTHEMSSGHNERRQRTRSKSPIDGRSRVDRKRNRSRTRSRSPTNDSRSKSWSRSRSPSHAYRQGSERWMDAGRMRGMPICRDFASGRCRRDDCRFLHEGGGLRQIGRQHDAGSTDGRGSRSDNVNYSREKLSRRHDDPYEDGRGNKESRRGSDNNESHRGYRVPNRCFDFTQGRCQRGASCRYAHHGASSEGGWNARDESRVRSHDRSGSENRTQEWKPVYDVPCKFFLENNCRNGERCKFSHQVKPADIPAASSVDSGLHDLTAHFAPPLPCNGQMQQIMHSHSQNSHNQFPVLLPMPNSPYFNTSLHSQPSQPLRYEQNLQNPDSQVLVQQNLLMHSQNESSYNLNGRIQQNVPPIHIVQNQPDFNSGVPTQRNVPPIHHAQNQPDFNNAVPIQQKFPPNHNVQNQPDLNFGIPIQQNVAPIHKAQNQADFNLGIQIQQNVPPTHKSQNQTDFNLGIPLQQNVPSIHSALNLPNFNLGVPIQQNVPPTHNVQNQTDFNPRVPVQHNVPPTHNVQNQSDFKVGVLSQQNLASGAGRRHQDATSTSHISDAKILMEKNQTSVQQHMALQCVDSLDHKSSQTNSDIPITNKVVTSEQAAKIIDLSASLAQFFGTAALNPQSTAGMTPQPFLNPDSLSAFATTAAPLPTEVDSSRANLSRPIQQVVSSNEREAEKTEASQINKDQIEQLPSDDEECKKDGDSKKIKEGKDVRMFKCALIEFIKDMLKPKWKEGQLSKEAHKTIVKKVVDKVCGSLQGLNVPVPQTQEKIDLYLLGSKPKLSKLVQAYVEKYVKS